MPPCGKILYVGDDDELGLAVWIRRIVLSFKSVFKRGMAELISIGKSVPFPIYHLMPAMKAVRLFVLCHMPPLRMKLRAYHNPDELSTRLRYNVLSCSMRQKAIEDW